MKLSAKILSTPLSIAINNSLKYGVFLGDAKIATVIPLDKGKPNKNEISNFRPVSILNTFSKIYEKIIKDQLVSGLVSISRLSPLPIKKDIVPNMS